MRSKNKYYSVHLKKKGTTPVVRSFLFIYLYIPLLIGIESSSYKL